MAECGARAHSSVMGDTELAAADAESPLLPASAVVVSSWKVGVRSRVAEEGGSKATAVDVGDISGWMCRAADEFEFVLELESALPVGEVAAAAAALSTGVDVAGVAGVAVAAAVAAASSSGTVAALATMAGVGVS